MKTLIIVESPTKAKTIAKFIDTKEYKVESSFGHIRDLPVSKMGIDIENNFTPDYEVPKSKAKVVAALKKILPKVDTVILATDEDREGEAIAWHLLHALDLKKKKVQRIAFHEITKTAIEEALKNPREINTHLVDAQQARRVLDRLVGYELSPFLWKKVAKGLSAGRVQSAAVRLIVEKEEEIREFKQDEYWSIKALLDTKGGETKPKVSLKISETKDDKKDGKDTKDSKDETKTPEETSQLETQSNTQLIAGLHSKNGKSFDKLAINSKDQAQKILDDLVEADYQVKFIDKKEQRRSPQAPFTTSTLQQTANRRLGFSAKQTMFLAQQLYEGIDLGSQGHHGLITYMRTDSFNLSEKFLTESRDLISKEFGKDYLPEKANTYTTKSKGAQEAHEAIRPTEVSLEPEKIKAFLDEKQFKLYQLIWQRAVACQMMPSVMDATVIDIAAGDYIVRATGQTVKFAGFTKVYPTDTKETILPELENGQNLNPQELRGSQHFTKPPARYSDATLVKKLEELGIGRPSTYAPIISTIQDRNYVDKDGRHLIPTEMGEIVNKILVKHFPKIVDYNFTADMEESFDQIASDGKEWIPVIKDFYTPFKKNLEAKQEEVSKKDLEEETDEVCDKCNAKMMIKVGRFGKFMACTAYPECKNTKPINGEGEAETAPQSLGKDPKSGLDVFVMTGRFGPYVQLGEKTDENPKPQRTSLKYAPDPKNPTLEDGLKLLSLPRTLGDHPEKKEPVIANVGRFGPYVGCDGDFRSIREPDNVFDIDLDRALELLAQPKSANSKKVLKDLGEYKKKKTSIQSGRYGPYIKYGTKNIALPKELKTDEKAGELTLEQAGKIIDESGK